MTNLNLIADYHTHTFFSHGKGTIEANARAAISMHLDTLAVTDHGLGHLVRGLTRDEIKLARKQVDSLNSELHGKIRILLGVEANIVSLDGTIDLPENMWDYFDVVLVGYHPIARFEHMSDLFKMYIRNALPKKRGGVIERNTFAYIRAIERYKIDIIAHPGHMMPIDVSQVANVAASYGTVMEINCKHGVLNTQQATLALEQGTMFAISSDAHMPFSVGKFQNGLKIANDAKIPAERIINSTEGSAFTMRNGFKLKEGV